MNSIAESILACHPCESDLPEHFAADEVAQKLVHARHTKSDMKALVRWLIVQIQKSDNDLWKAIKEEAEAEEK